MDVDAELMGPGTMTIVETAGPVGVGDVPFPFGKMVI